MKRTTRVLVWLGQVTLALSACESPISVELDPGPLLQTSEGQYELEWTGNGYRSVIPYTFENRTLDTVFLVNCNGATPPMLEVKQDGQWVAAWYPVLLLCLSPAIEIQPGDLYRDTLRFFGALPDSGVLPAFEQEPVEGIYRLRWTKALTSFDPDSTPFGEPLDYSNSVSNAFSLELR